MCIRDRSPGPQHAGRRIRWVRRSRSFRLQSLVDDPQDARCKPPLTRVMRVTLWSWAQGETWNDVGNGFKPAHAGPDEPTPTALPTGMVDSAAAGAWAESTMPVGRAVGVGSSGPA